MVARFAHLDGLRGVAALNVAVGHAVLAFDFALYSGKAADGHGEWDVAAASWPLLLPVAGQNFSVCVFLVLSGFVLAHAFGASSLGAAGLIAKRYVRLGLPILAATLFAWSLLRAGLVANHEAAALTRSAWLDIQMSHGASIAAALQEGLFGSLLGPWSYAASYDSSLWTMSVEFAGSVLLIILCKARARAGPAGRAALLWGAAPLAVGAALYPCYVGLVLAGAGLQMLGAPQWLRRRAAHPAIGAGLVGLALLAGTIPYAEGAIWDALRQVVPSRALPLPSALFGLPGAAAMDRTSLWHGFAAVLLLLGVEVSPGLRQLLSRPWVGFLGLVSFPLYLVHVPVLLSVGCGVFLLGAGAGLPYPAAVALGMAAYGAVALALATAAVWLVERPAVRAANWLGAATDGVIRRAPFNPAASRPSNG